MDINSLLSGSIILAIIGSLTYYFGKISMPEVNKRNPDKFNYYDQGIKFSIIFIIIPTVLVLILDLSYSSEPFNPFYITFHSESEVIIFIIIGLIFLSVCSFPIFLFSSQCNPVFNTPKYKEEDIIPPTLGRTGILLFILFSDIFSSMMIYLWVKHILLFNQVIQKSYGYIGFLFVSSISILLITFWFITLTQIAKISSLMKDYASYKIYLDSGRIIEGIILKYGDLVEVINDENIIHISSKKINYMEEINSYECRLNFSQLIFIEKKKTLSTVTT